MSAGRRSFLRSVAAGSAAYVVGCDGGAPVPPAPMPDAGAPACGQPPPPALPPLDYPTAGYFDRVSADLDAAGIGTPVVFIDMDRVDANIDAITSSIAAPLAYRIVEKSLPSLDLLSYVSARSGSARFLVLHLPLLPALLGAFPNADVLVGKTHVTNAVRSFFDALPTGTDRTDVAARVILLADDRARLAELAELASALGVTLRVAVEIDVGLRRSGMSDPSELGPMLSDFLATPAVVFAGFLGYDGHVAYTPGSTPAAVGDAWNEATRAYQSFVNVLHEPSFEALASLPGLVFHSGGSATYPMYTSGTPVNDVAAGGGVLRPGGYPNHVISDLSPAIFIATPVLRRYETPRLPFFTPEQSACVLDGLQGLTIYGGGWPALYTHPPGIRPAPFVSDPTDPSLVPNQGMVTAPAELAIEPGDWTFFHPRQSDALFSFDAIHLVRGGRLQPETMAAFPRRY
jgi:D-serine deaminase-like pyridoxal phosphate-dependent protein